jgi:hypothetical protein
VPEYRNAEQPLRQARRGDNWTQVFAGSTLSQEWRPYNPPFVIVMKIALFWPEKTSTECAAHFALLYKSGPCYPPRGRTEVGRTQVP